MINPVITAIIAREEQATIDFRRDLHAHPELPWEERRTTDRVVAELENIGIACRRTVPTGVIADITGSKPGKTVALRADMDALPVHELNDRLSYKSLTAGKMHACGHDSHTAMLLTAARALYEVREQMAGNVRLIFQPAEEIAEGAKAMIARGPRIMSTTFLACTSGPARLPAKYPATWGRHLPPQIYSKSPFAAAAVTVPCQRPASMRRLSPPPS